MPATVVCLLHDNRTNQCTLMHCTPQPIAASGHAGITLFWLLCMSCRLVVWLGCLCCCCGYLGLYLLASGKAPGSFWQLIIFAIAAGNTGTWFDTSALVTNVRNFPNDRGFVVGVLKSFLGLSSSIYTTLYMTAFEQDAVKFLLMLAFVPPALGIIMSLGLNYVPYVETSEGLQGSKWFSTEGRFLTSFLLVAALALYQMVSAVLIGQQELSPTSKQVMVAGMAGLLALAAGLPVHCSGWRAAYLHDYIHTRESAPDDEQQPPNGVYSSPQIGGESEALLREHSAQPQFGTRASKASRPCKAVQVKEPPARPRKSAGGPWHQPGSGGASSSRPRSSDGSTASKHNGHLSSGQPGHLAADENRQSIGEAPSLSMPADTGEVHQHSSASSSASAGDASDRSNCDCVQLHLRNFTTKEMMHTTDFWLLFFQFVVAAGVCLAFLNNLGQLVVSLQGGQDGQVVFVSLFSVANAAGRLLMGYIPEQHLHARGTPRTLFLTLTAAVTAACSLAVAYADIGHLYVISILLGVAFGAHWSLLPAISSDLFGLKHFAPNYTTLQFAPAIGSYLLATRLTGWLYDRAAVQHGDPHECIGPDCFREAFLILAGLAAVSSLACSIATSRSKSTYTAISMHLRVVHLAETRTTGHAEDGLHV
eukprot:GHRR01016846.1.p1 GENE.GHRR01016846.1~~GHRR01016846.1.p1  ORF type:complete len:649 (+),score=200.09 GHRR01016846.1:867-2813(+)